MKNFPRNYVIRYCVKNLHHSTGYHYKGKKGSKINVQQ